MKIIRARAPLRVGLAGGGTDVSPFCDIHGGCVVNATIDKFAYATIKTLKEPLIKFTATDLQEQAVHSLEDSLPLDGVLNLHKAVYNHMMNQFNDGQRIPIELSTFCDAPAGSGLGSSSTLVVAMISAFAELMQLELNRYTIGNLAYKIERLDCGLKGGRQDQYSAAFGGFNFMEFGSKNSIAISQLELENWVSVELEASLVLFFTGVSRESAKIISQQSNNVSEGLVKSIDAMHCMKQEALIMKEALVQGNFKDFVECMQIGWKNKKRSAQSVSNGYIDNIFSTAIEAGALAGKVSGAGGGGFMLFFVPPEKRMNVIRNLKKLNGQVSNCHFTKDGAEAWRIK